MMTFNNKYMKLYMLFDFDLYRVVGVFSTDKQANNYCRQHKNVGVIATDDNELVYVAEFQPTKM